MSPSTRPRILIVDDDVTTRRLVGMVMKSENCDIVEAATGEEGLAIALGQPLDLAILDIMMPGMDGYALCRQIRASPITHALPVILLSAKDSLDDKLAGFEAGANDYLVKPFSPTELAYRAKTLLRGQEPAPQVQAPTRPRGLIITVFGTKGGIGKTTLSVNVAIALSQQTTGKRTAIFDADLYFGDVGEHLNLPPAHNIMDLIAKIGALDARQVDDILIPHTSGVRALLNPSHPEQSTHISPDHLNQVLDALAAYYDFIVVDCPPTYEERALTILERADCILLVVTPEIGSLKSMRIFLEVAQKLGLDPTRFHIVLNRFDSDVGIKPEEIERALQRTVRFRLPSGGRSVALSINRGVPIVLAQPNHPVSQQIRNIAAELAQMHPLHQARERS